MTTFISSVLLVTPADTGGRMQCAAISLAVQHDEALPVLLGIAVQVFIKHVK